MRNATVWAGMFGVEKSTVIDGVEFEDESESIVVVVRPRKGVKQRCGVCQRRCPRYDHGEGRRRWRGPDLGLVRSFLEADAPRVTCREHGVVVASVPWARHGARHTRVFEDTVVWMATRTSKSTLEVLLRIAWRTVGAIVTRVHRYVAVRDAGLDPRKAPGRAHRWVPRRRRQAGGHVREGVRADVIHKRLATACFAEDTAALITETVR